MKNKIKEKLAKINIFNNIELEDKIYLLLNSKNYEKEYIVFIDYLLIKFNNTQIKNILDCIKKLQMHNNIDDIFNKKINVDENINDFTKFLKDKLTKSKFKITDNISEFLTFLNDYIDEDEDKNKIDDLSKEINILKNKKEQYNLEINKIKNLISIIDKEIQLKENLVKQSYI